MEITRTRDLTIRMGEYESFRTSATVRVSHHDLGLTDETLHQTGVDVAEALIDRANAALDAAMADDIADAQELTGDRKSFIHRIPTEKD